MRRSLKSLPYRAWLLGVFLVILVAGSIRPVEPLDMALEHVPTVVALSLLVYNGRRRPLSNISYSLLFIFLVLHVIGAHYLYSNVPYDAWSKALSGRGLNELFGWERNHYDRFVHFMFGLLIAPVAADMGERFGLVTRGFWSALFGVGFITLCGNAYEVIEWLLTLVLAGRDAENYNGQQGDMFDAVKDLGLNVLGAVLGVIPILVGTKRATPRPANPA